MSDEPSTDDFFDEQAQRLHENPEQECVAGCWVCASARWGPSDYVGPLVEVTQWQNRTGLTAHQPIRQS